MPGYIGYGLPFSYVGPALAFIAFSTTLLTVTGLREVLRRHQIPR